MSTCYVQLRLRGLGDYTNFSFSAIFTAQDTGRQFETNKLKINPSGISVEANFPLQKNENPKNCTVRINVYLPTGRLLEPQPFVGTTYTRESGSSVKHTVHEVKLVTHHTSQEKDHSIDKIAVNRSVHPPEGLYTVAYYNAAINASAAKYGVDPMTIGSIVFQEKFYSSAAIAKNYVAYAKDKFGVKPHRSYGLGEMQLGLAAKLLGFPESDPNRLRKTFDLITNDPQVATDMVAKNIQLKQLKLGRQLTPREATILHNAGESGLDSFLDPAEDKTNFENPKKVYNRSRNWQESIRQALRGVIYSKPDSCPACTATPRTLHKYWTPGEGYSGL